MDEIDAPTTMQEVTNWTLSDGSSRTDQLQSVAIYNQNPGKCFAQTTKQQTNKETTNKEDLLHSNQCFPVTHDDNTPMQWPSNFLNQRAKFHSNNGSASSSELPITTEPKRDDSKRIVELENEKEQLSSSLFALTSRFAQVQFRLHQIQVAKEEDRPKLLEELIAFVNKTDEGDSSVQSENVLLIRQQKVISELKERLEDLESFAFQQGASALPPSLEPQKQHAQQLPSRPNPPSYEVNLAHTSDGVLRSKVDNAVAEIVNPGVVQAKLVDHLQTQIHDLERYVDFLQAQREHEGMKKAAAGSSSKAARCWDAYQPSHCAQTGVETVHSQKGKEKMAHEGYIYQFDAASKKDKAVKFWKCEKRGLCKCRIHTRDGIVIKICGTHSHYASSREVEVTKARTELKRKAVTDPTTPSDLVMSEVKTLSTAVQGALPKPASLQQLIRRKRKKASQAPPIPESATSLVIPEEFKRYTNSMGETEDFLLADSGAEEDRILIFGRRSWLSILEETDVCFVDGTFKMAPTPLFAQVVVLLGKSLGGLHPVLYALLPNKRRETYEKMFCMIMAVTRNFHPPWFSCDLEKELISAIQVCFPNSVLQGCFFHLVHNLQEHLTACGLYRRCVDDSLMALQAKMIVALAFVPVCEIDVYFDALSDFLPLELMPLINWFEDYYVGRPERSGRGRRQALFPIEMWSQYDRTIRGEDTANNYAEAAHLRLYAQLEVQRPGLWRFIDALRLAQAERDFNMRQLSAGDAPRCKLQKYIDADRRLLETVQSRPMKLPIVYLKEVAHCFLCL